jgi:hypothetical protein
VKPALKRTTLPPIRYTYTSMEPLFRLLAIAALLAIVASLGLALYHLSRGQQSPKLVRALTIRVGLSVLLFLALMAAWYFGLITPHGSPLR